MLPSNPAHHGIEGALFEEVCAVWTPAIGLKKATTDHHADGR
jgi:hypothetical protein